MTKLIMANCNCFYCESYRIWEQAIKDRDFATITELGRTAFNGMISAEFELSYHRLVLDGDWPSAVAVLENALKKAKEKAEIRKD